VWDMAEQIVLGAAYAVAAVMLSPPDVIRRASWWLRPVIALVVAAADVLQLFVAAPGRLHGGRRRHPAIS